MDSQQKRQQNKLDVQSFKDVRIFQAETMKNRRSVENIGAYRGPEMQNTTTQRHKISENMAENNNNKTKNRQTNKNHKMMMCFFSCCFGCVCLVCFVK